MGTAVAAAAELAPGEAERELLRLRSAHPRLTIQLVVMNRLPGAGAVMMIAAQTLRAKETGALLAAKPEVDLLLRLAGTSQITEALQKHGYGAQGAKMLVAAGSNKGVERLRRELSGSKSYRVLEPERVDEEDLDMVEVAALLGTKT
ncbi:MAG: KEOPS complex subunit Cgi121 [Thaumarchaeota archaeon]|nr:KEOPS complex subunit Cgi121 [Nitrososphaerota archaeon]